MLARVLLRCFTCLAAKPGASVACYYFRWQLPSVLTCVTCWVCSEARERYRQRRIEEGLDPDDGGNPNAWRGTDAEASELMVYHTAILRNKQLLFNYV